LWLPKMDQKLLKAAQPAEYTRRAAPAGAPTCTSILDRDGEEVTEPEQVVEVFRQHYETPTPTSATFDEGHSQHVAQAVAQWASDEGQRVNANMTGRSLQRRLKKRSKTCPRTKLATLTSSRVSLSKQVALRWKRYSCSYSTGCGLAKSCPQPGPRES
jgi:hypothetical protein